AAAAGPGAMPPPPAVTVAPVETKEIVEWSVFTGRTEAVESVEVRPRVTGYIKEVRFKSGQLVKQGEVLFVVDPRWHKAEYDRTKAEVEKARTQLQNAEREAKRSQQLLLTKAISDEEADTRNTAAASAKAALLSAEAARDTAKLDFEHTEVRAPISGRVSRAYLTEGNYVSGVAGFTTLLTTIMSVDPVYVYADVDEGALLRFRSLALGDGKVSVEMGLSDEQGFPRKGTIESFDNRVDAGTGSILLRSEFANTDGRIIPGLFVRIRVPGSQRYPAILIDERAIGTDQAQKFVLTLSPTNTVEYRPIQMGPMVEGKRVVRSGLKAGEQIVVNGLARVRPGMPVTPQKLSDQKPAPQTAQVAH
ncbi:MAG TPA: efflux RND transporter periplasmic adaptor subunit, partial [Roseimicrobium sp.]|nr:efflux RND transporter periplasmic adaptor subunit [Roseimicrobium sp.]